MKGEIVYMFGWCDLDITPEIQAFIVDKETTTVVPHPPGLNHYSLRDYDICSEGDMLYLVQTDVFSDTIWNMKF